jgi:DNA replication protein DnaC
MTEPTRLAPKVAAVRAAAARRPDPHVPYTDPDDTDQAAPSMEGLRARLWSGSVPSRFCWATIDQFDNPAEADYYQPAAAAELRDWAKSPRGRNLVLLGPVGVGKSHAAVAAVRPQFDRGQEVRFLPVVELLDMLRPGGPDGALYDLAGTDLLVLDDVGSERPTEWTAERLYALVNRRWLEERPTVVTSNLAPDTLADTLGERLWSRLVGSGAVAVGMAGPDRRRLA